MPTAEPLTWLPEKRGAVPSSSTQTPAPPLPKSGSYLLNFMESYKLKRQFRLAHADAGRRRELQGLLQAADGLLPASAIRALRPGGPRERATPRPDVRRHRQRCLATPVAAAVDCPTTGLRGAFADPKLAGFTKRLVFSSWSMVPQVIATLVSYEAERQMMRIPLAGLREHRGGAASGSGRSCGSGAPTAGSPA